VTLAPFSVNTVTTGFVNLRGILYDGANIWAADFGFNRVRKLDSNGAIVQSLPTGTGPGFPAFDGMNIWVPNRDSHSVTVVRVKDGQGNPLPMAFILATLTGNGLNEPAAAAFDGERILVTNNFGDSVSLWKAADLTPAGSFSTFGNTRPVGACSDGLNFWVALSGSDRLARF
jgi:hypothetical protein